ncbi:RNA-directed DNA polymerase, eukaryota, reverse transcriptase zinc-binding domain protein [Tanacetum coccineum]|uniref:RNA-directed DNA polymerase, eukaryota, reverse transcriptase zinc-binding domain protein n=1 Tax=Tanacetum coccineum TaxID=301880 RepID=A0ABQ5ALG4_9ASTR
MRSKRNPKVPQNLEDYVHSINIIKSKNSKNESKNSGKSNEELSKGSQNKRYNVERKCDEYCVEDERINSGGNKDRERESSDKDEQRDQWSRLIMVHKGVNNKPLVVQKWSIDMCLNKTEPKRIPVWVKLRNVPMEAWSVKEKGIKDKIEIIYKSKNISEGTKKCGCGMNGSSEVMKNNEFKTVQNRKYWREDPNINRNPNGRNGQQGIMWNNRGYTIEYMKRNEKLVGESRSQKEKKNNVEEIQERTFKMVGAFPTNEMTEFQECIDNIEVLDLHSEGFHFTWTKSLRSPKCSTLKKLDRIMVNEDFVDIFQLAHGVFLPYLILF